MFLYFKVCFLCLFSFGWLCIVCATQVYAQKPVVSANREQNIEDSKFQDTISLNNIVISGTKKSKIQQDAMKLSFMPNQALKQGSSIVDLFKNTPLISYNEAGADGMPEINIIGKSSTRIFINGKPTFMPLESIIAMLSAQSAQDIERIEVITNPKPSPDIEQGGGVVNIILKKSVETGWIGSLRLEGAQNHLSSGSFGATAAYQHSKFNFSVNSFVGTRARRSEREINNNFLHTKTLQQSVSLIPARNIMGGAMANFSYKMAKQHDIIISLGAFGMNRTMLENNKNLFYQLPNPNEIQQSYLVNNTMKRVMFAGRITADYEYKPDNEGSSLQFKTMITYLNSNPITYLNTIHNTSSIELAQTSELKSLSYRLMALYNHVFNKKHSLESGLSFMNSRTNNNFAVQRKFMQQWHDQPSRGLKYDYKTPNYIAYISHMANWNKYWQTLVNFSIQYYQQQGISENSQQNSGLFSKNYLFLLPNIAISYQLNQNNLFSLSLTRLSRPPSFMDVNPFVIQQGNNTFTQGNATLLVPDNYESSLSYTFLQSYTFVLRYNFTHNDYTKIQSLGKNENTILTLPFNYGTLHAAHASLALSQSFFHSYWQFHGNFALQYSYYKGEIPLFRLQKGGFGGELALNNIISLTKPVNSMSSWLLNLDFKYNLPSFLLYGINSIGPRLSLGVKKKYNQWSFALMFQDILHSAYYVSVISMPGVLKTNTQVYRDTRLVRLSVNFGFGNGKKGFMSNHNAKYKNKLKLKNESQLENLQKGQPGVQEEESNSIIN